MDWWICYRENVFIRFFRHLFSWGILVSLGLSGWLWSFLLLPIKSHATLLGAWQPPIQDYVKFNFASCSWGAPANWILVICWGVILVLLPVFWQEENLLRLLEGVLVGLEEMQEISTKLSLIIILFSVSWKMV